MDYRRNRPRPARRGLSIVFLGSPAKQISSLLIGWRLKVEDTRTEFEKSLDPSYKPGPSPILEKPANTVKEMEEALDHTRPLMVSFRCRFHAMECWSAVKNILETCQVDQKTSGVMMEAMSTLAECIDDDVRKELQEKAVAEEASRGEQQ
jgi:hypothetical protein